VQFILPRINGSGCGRRRQFPVQKSHDSIYDEPGLGRLPSVMTMIHQSSTESLEPLRRHILQLLHCFAIPNRVVEDLKKLAWIRACRMYELKKAHFEDRVSHSWEYFRQIVRNARRKCLLCRQESNISLASDMVGMRSTSARAPVALCERTLRVR
jgi:hypothetical protein